MTATHMPPYAWQEAIWQSFVRQVVADSLPHALLLSAPEGVGVEKLATAMGHYLLCKAPIEGLACGSCKACKLIAAGSHPDLCRVEPMDNSKAIKVDQIRAVTEFVAKTSQQGGRKVVLIQPAEAMNPNAANSLLKCLEEPAGDTVLLLVSAQISRLMPTIRSRCSKVSLALPTQSEALSWLQGMGVENPQAILEEAGGAPLTALDWWQSDYVTQRTALCESLVSMNNGAITASALAASWSSKDAAELITTLLSWVERLIRERALGESSLRVTENGVWEEFKLSSSSISVAHLFRYRDALCIRKSQLQSGSNINGVLAVEELLFDWKALLRASQKQLTRA